MQNATELSRAIEVTRKLLTCRYWALGPSCPSIIKGVDHCQFAHWDTGRLASPLEQRGTCLNFSQHGYCYKGGSCWYEHRDCGVTGLYQGSKRLHFSCSLWGSLFANCLIAIELDGMELEIANAACKGGFNTTNHEGLLELIWAVKRVALRRFRGSNLPQPPPPKHPIYPDRFRPSGVGDNTARKRKRIASDSKDNLSRLTPPSFNPVPSLDQKGGTKEDPIALDSENETVQPRAPAKLSAKRQKKLKANHANNRLTNVNKFANKYPPRNSGAAGQFNVRGAQTSGSNRLPLRKPNRLLNPVASRYSPIVRSEIARPDNSFLSYARPSGAIASLRPEDKIITQLERVKAQLSDARNTMSYCQEDMKALFERHRDTLNNSDMMIILRSLANDMNKSWEGAKAGMTNVDGAIGWLNEDKGEETLIDI